MNLSLNWLKEFVKYTQTPEKIAEIFSLGAFEVEKLVEFGKGLEDVVIGDVRTVVSHPRADKLRVCKVDVGRKQLQNIVCGAPNVKAGQKVAVALVSTTLPNGMKVERRRIRGIDSEGMICAEDELGLGNEHDGIMVLDPLLKSGRKFLQAIKLNDTALDLSIQPNRADGFSVIGLARDFSALSGQKFTEQKVAVPESKKVTTNKLLSVHIRDYDLCPKYTARIVHNVKIGPSPVWMQSRLRVSGVKPINNIIDITNYVMLEYGQPLHAFDYSKVHGKKIVVRKAGTDKQFQTLDGNMRTLSPEMLMIADGHGPVAIAGVMGGENSEISNCTKDIVIESAIFKPISVRKTRQKLGLVTEASTRFEKGIWWDLPEQAADRAAQLMDQYAGGDVAKGIISVSKEQFKKPTVVTVGVDYINNLIGRKFTSAEVIKNLERLFFKVAKGNGSTLKVIVPSWRQDISLPADIAEEVGRLYGWNKLKPAPITGALKPVLLSEQQRLEKKLKDILVSLGMTEVYNYSFYGKKLMDQFELDEKKHYRVQNPLNQEQEYLRTTLVPRLFENILQQYQQYDAIALFEIGTVFYKTTKELPDEKKVLSGIMYAKKGVSVVRIIISLLEKLGFSQEQIQLFSIMGTWRTAAVQLDGKQAGEYGEVPTGTEKFGNPAMFFSLDLDALVKQLTSVKHFTPIPEYQSVEHALTFITPVETVFQDVVSVIKRTSTLVVDVHAAKDLYKDSEKTRSATFTITMQALDRTLTAGEIENVRGQIITTVDNKFNMKIKK